MEDILKMIVMYLGHYITRDHQYCIDDKNELKSEKIAFIDPDEQYKEERKRKNYKH